MIRIIISAAIIAMTVWLQGCFEDKDLAENAAELPRRALLPSQVLPKVADFNVTSSDVKTKLQMGIDQAHESVSGKSVSPELSWSGAPNSTKSYAVTCFDPDAPTGSGFWHWVVVDIPANIHSLKRGSGIVGDGSLPQPAFHIRNDFGQFGFGGAAPPIGDLPHRYVFTIHALDIETLGLPKDASPAFAGFLITKHSLARAEIIPTFKR